MTETSLISIVDDDQSVLDSLRRLMRALGHTVQTFSSAADFLASPRLAETACLIADVHMPGMNGDELHRRLVGLGYAIPTILITAYPEDNVKARALKDGVISYLHKPFNKNDLLDCIRSALRCARQL